MQRERVAKTWTFRGLSDLLFAFHNDDVAFEANARFSEIMGLEKILKSALLHSRYAEYEHLPNGEAKKVINRLAAKYGHDFDGMLNSLNALGVSDIEIIKRTEFDGYGGSALIEALKNGYMETRYPVPEPVSNGFPIENTDFTHDPLCSSGMIKFVYALSNACIFYVSRAEDLADIHSQFQAQFAHLETLSRFNNLFWEPRCRPRAFPH